MMGSNHAVSGVKSIKFILATGFNQSTLWRELAQCFDFDSVSFLCVYLSLPHLKRLSLLFIFPILAFVSFLMIPSDSYLENIGLPSDSYLENIGLPVSK